VAITVANINTGAGYVTAGGTVATADVDGFYIGVTGGTDLGATTGGITITYTLDTTDIFADQTLPPVDIALTSETATIEFDMLETQVANLKWAVSQAVTKSAAGYEKLAAGGRTIVTFIPVTFDVADDDTGLMTKWTFFKCLAGGLEMNFERDAPSTVGVTFTAHADTTHASGHQLFSVRQLLT
jgi:hypothetical protein